VKRLPVQLLVVVAIIKMCTLKCVVELGSLCTVIGDGLIVPKVRVICFLVVFCLDYCVYHLGMWLILVFLVVDI
jgi:hypothetical protein